MDNNCMEGLHLRAYLGRTRIDSIAAALNTERAKRVNWKSPVFSVANSSQASKEADSGAYHFPAATASSATLYYVRDLWTSGK
ncbi:hypothetical protein e2017b09.tmp0291 [Eimeria tenella]|uniref:Uncharacterized protein n=1 Tax=Eimeria tenella TaxID=5802 RepID=C8TDX9_EIMTE|nr:hypothetical protein e2017b09.tmp0291 [Eimeria tenella]